MRTWGQTPGIAEFHEEYFVGTNGKLSLQQLELARGTSWRDYIGGKQLFSKKKKLGTWLQGLISQHGTHSALLLAQKELDKFPKRGSSTAPNWEALIEFISPPIPRPKRALGAIAEDMSMEPSAEAPDVSPWLHDDMAIATDIA